MAAVRWVRVGRLLLLRSSEAERLVCARGHLIGVTVCGDGCRVVTGLSLVGQVLPFKDPRHVAALPLPVLDSAAWPLQMERGYLLDGHHRVAAARLRGLSHLPVVTMRGVLAVQRQWHHRVQGAAAGGQSMGAGADSFS